MIKLTRQLTSFFLGHFRRSGGLSRTNHVTRLPSGLILKRPGPIFYRGWRPYDPKVLLQNEVEALYRLQHSHHFPKVVSFDLNQMLLEDAGEPLCITNLPNDAPAQALEILQELESSGIEHRDIKTSNLLVKNSTLILIDFGWARIDRKGPDQIPHLYPGDPVAIRIALEHLLIRVESNN